MTDICMCRGEYCLIRENCYRFYAMPNIAKQAYFMYSPVEESGIICKSFLSPAAARRFIRMFEKHEKNPKKKGKEK